MRLSIVLAAVWLAGVHVFGEPHKEFPKVDDTSGAEASGERIIRLSAEMRASTNEVWRTITTAEGWKRYAVPFAAIDFQVGGIIETSYKADAKVGDPDNIKNQIVAYVPGRMLTIRCVQTPRNFEHKEEFLATATVFEIAPIAGGGSRVTLTAMGYRPGEAYDALFKFFRWGNAYTLNKLREQFEPESSKAQPAREKSKEETR